jgi:hypothetical protein
MKLQTARLWLTTLVMNGMMLAAAQSSEPISPPETANTHVPSVLGAVDHLTVTSQMVANAESSLPDAPSAIVDRESRQETLPSPTQSTEYSPRPPVGTVSTGVDAPFLVASGVFLGSTIANAETIARCEPSACQLVPNAIRSRGALYAIGIPATIGISYICYRLKRSGTRWWIAPIVLFTAGNIVYAAHASQYDQ